MCADTANFSSLFSEQDRQLFREGHHWSIYHLLGAQLCERDAGTDSAETHGVNFAVWAPAAKEVSVVGDFNNWDSHKHPMVKDASTGIWETFVPGLGPGDLYKFSLVDCYGNRVNKSDPFGFSAELPPQTASVVSDLGHFEWSDSDWMQGRSERQGDDQPISVYELHLGSWKTDPDRENGWKNYRDLAHEVVEYCKDLGFTHIELMPITEHPYTGSWGYQTVGYFAATSRYGSPADLMYFVNHCHENGIGVFADWVPAHFPKDQHGLRRFDGTGLYEHIDPRRGEHPDWGTLIFNFGRAQVKNFLIANALFWLDQYHFDGLRVDAVASMLYLDYSRDEGQWIPNQYGGRENLQAISFLRDVNHQVHEQFPGVLMIAEESTAWPGVSHSVESGGLGFDFKWNMGWMNDTLAYMKEKTIHRKFHHDKLTFSLVYAFSEKFVLPLSHDEVVHGKQSLIDKMPGDAWQMAANLRLLFGFMWTHPGKKVLFMGGEFGQWSEWNCEQPLPWHLAETSPHNGIQGWVRELNRLYADEGSLHEMDFQQKGFRWIHHREPRQSIIAFSRHAKDEDDFLVVLCNFTEEVVDDFRLDVPQAGAYREIANSDAEKYGGSGVINEGVFQADEADQNTFQIRITAPPLGISIWERTTSHEV